MKQMITGHTRLAALFAKPAKHSISPAMHNLSFEEQGPTPCIWPLMLSRMI